MEILVHWRELFKRGVPITIAIESSLQVWIQISQVQLDENQQKYLSSLLYNGFYGFEMLSERSLDDVVCGICGVIGQVYYGDGNEKNCCSIDEVTYSTENNDDLEDTPTSLEDFLSNLKTICVERITFPSSKQLSKVQASKVPSIIAPSLRGQVIYNTEFKKKSVYLNNQLLKKDEINGDPLLLFQKLQELNINMSTLESMTDSQLKVLCDYCKVEKAGSLSKSLMVSRLYSLYASLVTGSSACHGFTQVPGNTGGFYHMVCRHGTTVASKFLMLQESVRDAADLYLSLKYPPPLFVLDTPCGFSRHVNIRMPGLAAKYWGENLGCFEKPSLEVQPSQVSVPGIVTSEFGVAKVDVNSLNFPSDADPSLHPITGSSRRYVVGDRFHTSSNPHKSPLCSFHDINLSAQKDAIKTSYQECQNNSKNVKRLRGSTMQSFPIHFMYNFLMDYYHNEAIVQKQRENLNTYLKDNQVVTRDVYKRFVIV